MATADPSVMSALLKCKVCLEDFVNPKVLLCGHSFCVSCLLNLCGGARQISCPLCRQVTPIPETVAKLPDNFTIKEIAEAFSNMGPLDKGRKVKSTTFDVCTICVDEAVKATTHCTTCSLSLCDKCLGMHGSRADTLDHTLVETQNMVVCSVHDKPASHVCYDCCGSVCDACLLGKCAHHVWQSYRQALSVRNDPSHKVNVVAKFFQKAREIQSQRFRVAELQVAQHTDELVGRLLREKVIKMRDLKTIEATSIASIEDEEEVQVTAVTSVTDSHVADARAPLSSELIRSLLTELIVPQGCLRKVVFTPAEDFSVGSVDCEIETREAVSFDQLEVEYNASQSYTVV